MAKKKYIVGLSYTSGVNKKRLDTDKKQVTQDVFFEIIRVALRSEHSEHKLKEVENILNNTTTPVFINGTAEINVSEILNEIVEKSLETVIKPQLEKSGLTIGNLYFEVQC